MNIEHAVLKLVRILVCSTSGACYLIIKEDWVILGAQDVYFFANDYYREADDATPTSRKKKRIYTVIILSSLNS